MIMIMIMIIKKREREIVVEEVIREDE